MELKRGKTNGAGEAPAKADGQASGTAKLADKLAKKAAAVATEAVTPKKAETTPGTQPAVPTYIANLIKREAAGEQLADTDVDELRLWREDNPEPNHD